MNYLAKLCFMIIIAILTNGCGKVLLPYEEDPLCRRGINEGVCGSVSQVYKESFKMKGNNDAIK